MRIPCGSSRPWLVQEHCSRPMKVAAANGHLLAASHARARPRGSLTLAGQLELLQQRLGTRFPAVQTVCGGDETEVLPDGELIEQIGLVGDISRRLLRGDRRAHEVMTVDHQSPASRPKDSRQCAQRRRFPGAIRTN